MELILALLALDTCDSLSCRYVFLITKRINKVYQSHYRPEVPREFEEVKVPNYVTMTQDGGKVVSLTHRPLLPSGNTPGTHSVRG